MAFRYAVQSVGAFKSIRLALFSVSNSASPLEHVLSRSHSVPLAQKPYVSCAAASAIKNPWIIESRCFHNILTDNRRPKGRPCLKKRKKRRKLRIKTPNFWIPANMNLSRAVPGTQSLPDGNAAGAEGGQSKKPKAKKKRKKIVRIHKANHQRRMRLRQKFRAKEWRRRQYIRYGMRRRRALKRLRDQTALMESQKAWAQKLSTLKHAEAQAWTLKLSTLKHVSTTL
eukprot:TRINITY_DN35712_c0_g1_i1.p1 TRINITY_DN35712_c0_g1~~TRINITY_DN35712_c0_g1_i1.p1  ORF type:complete len:227 (+),score=28.89 TRINITY_DN35712_c0_g1_i1:76-756(+)